MKTHKLILPLMTATALILGSAGCDKQETSKSVTDEANKAAEAAKVDAAKTAEAARVDAAKAAEAAKVEAARIAEGAKIDAAKTAETAKAETAKAADSAKTSELIDKAKSLIAEGKYSDATSVLQQLAGKSLSSDQQKLVDGLKEQIQKALAAKATENAAGAAGNLLKK